MSHTKHVSHTAPAYTSATVAEPNRPRRPFDGVMIALSAALLVIFGIVIGRFVVTTQAVAVVDHFDAELSTLRAELVDLNRQLIQVQARETALQESSARYRELATAQQIRADRLAARQQTIGTLLSGLSSQREARLAEVQQYVALNQPLPAIEVLRFAEAMFDAQHAALCQFNSSGIASGESMSQSIPHLPGFQPIAQSCPTLPVPNSTHQVVASSRPQQRAFFTPPQPKQPLQSNIYFPPGRSQQILTMPGKSGITFHDTAANDTDTIRR